MILTLPMIWRFFRTKKNQMQEKTSLIETTAATLGLNMYKGKTKVMKTNSKNNSPTTFQGEVLDELQYFTYLGCIMDTNGGTDSDVRAGITKIRNSREISIPTKLPIFNTNVKVVLMYESETWLPQNPCYRRSKLL